MVIVMVAILGQVQGPSRVGTVRAEQRALAHRSDPPEEQATPLLQPPPGRPHRCTTARRSATGAVGVQWSRKVVFTRKPHPTGELFDDQSEEAKNNQITISPLAALGDLQSGEFNRVIAGQQSPAVLSQRDHLPRPAKVGEFERQRHSRDTRVRSTDPLPGGVVVQQCEGGADWRGDWLLLPPEHVGLAREFD